MDGGDDGNFVFRQIVAVFFESLVNLGKSFFEVGFGFVYFEVDRAVFKFFINCARDDIAGGEFFDELFAFVV